jgi:hypothetical protein
MPTCSICDHPRLQEIERELANGAPLRQLEEQYPGVSRSALSRHQQHRGEAAQPEDPAASLCPAQDPAVHTATRETLRQAVQAAQQQLATITEALTLQEQEVARIVALEALHAFQPLRSDDDIRHQPAYGQWMSRPKAVRDTLEHLLTSWRQALRSVYRAQGALSSHDHAVAQYERQRAFLETPQGQEMERQYQEMCAAIEAAKRVENARLARVYEMEAEQVKQAFLVAIPQARRAAA